MTKIPTDAELSEIRAQLARRDPNVGGGYTWTTIEKLLNHIDALRVVESPDSDDVIQIMTGCGTVSVDRRYASPGTDFRL